MNADKRKMLQDSQIGSGQDKFFWPVVATASCMLSSKIAWSGSFMPDLLCNTQGHQRSADCRNIGLGACPCLTFDAIHEVIRDVPTAGALAYAVGGQMPETQTSNPGIQHLIFGAFGLPFGLALILICGGALLSHVPSKGMRFIVKSQLIFGTICPALSGAVDACCNRLPAY